jgi:hypothetical protein
MKDADIWPIGSPSEAPLQFQTRPTHFILVDDETSMHSLITALLDGHG